MDRGMTITTYYKDSRYGKVKRKNINNVKTYYMQFIDGDFRYHIIRYDGSAINLPANAIVKAKE